MTPTIARAFYILAKRQDFPMVFLRQFPPAHSRHKLTSRPSQRPNVQPSMHALGCRNAMGCRATLVPASEHNENQRVHPGRCPSPRRGALQSTLGEGEEIRVKGEVKTFQGRCLYLLGWIITSPGISHFQFVRNWEVNNGELIPQRISLIPL